MSKFSKEALDRLEAAKTPAAERETVLLVDDKDANLSVMAAILRPHFNLLEARDGEEAYNLIASYDKREELACIVSDHRMPRMTGVELLEKVVPLLPQTRRIIVTGYIDLDAAIDAINKSEVSKFIIKPFEAADFLEKVQAAVAGFRDDRALARQYAAMETELAAAKQALAQLRGEHGA
ncbi:MAG TPA: response regulator [Burkholderiaceae bacterium]